MYIHIISISFLPESFDIEQFIFIYAEMQINVFLI